MSSEVDKKLTVNEQEAIADWTLRLETRLTNQIALEQERYSVPEDRNIMLGAPSDNLYHPELSHECVQEGEREYTKAELVWVRRDALRYARQMLRMELLKLEGEK